MSQHRISLRWRPRLLLLVLAISAACMLPTSGTASANSAGYYCGILLAGHSDCAIYSVISSFGENRWVGYFNNNHVYRPDGGGTSVCEHTYNYSTGSTVSRRCAGGYIQSYCDLYSYYNNSVVLNAHAGNNASSGYKVDGHVVVDNPQQQCV